MVEYIKGNLLDADADVICQQVNCRSVMGAGLALQISNKYPLVKTSYLTFCEGIDPQHLLGLVLIVAPPDAPYRVANIFGQLNYGRSKQVYTSYAALAKAFSDLNDRCKGQTLAFPYGFGCGLAGGDWQTVLHLIEKNLQDCTVQIYKL